MSQTVVNLTIKNLGDAMEEHKIKAKIDLGEPSKELLEWAESHINEDPDKKDLQVSQLRDMIFERGKCTPSRTDDEFLIRFLRARYFNVKLAHKLYVNLHIFQEEAPEYFANVDLEKMLEIAGIGLFNCTPNRDHLGRRMLLIRIGKWVPSEYTPIELLQFVIFLIRVTLLEPETQIKGSVVLVDLSGLSLEMAWYMTPTLARHLVNIGMTACPNRLEAVHFLYSSWIFDTAFYLIKGLLPETVTDRIIFHNDLDTLYNDIDPKYLPKSLGGAIEDYSLQLWLNDIDLSEEKVLNELEAYGYPVRTFMIEKKMI